MRERAWQAVVSIEAMTEYRKGTSECYHNDKLFYRHCEVRLHFSSHCFIIIAEFFDDIPSPCVPPIAARRVMPPKCVLPIGVEKASRYSSVLGMEDIFCMHKSQMPVVCGPCCSGWNPGSATYTLCALSKVLICPCLSSFLGRK